MLKFEYIKSVMNENDLIVRLRGPVLVLLSLSALLLPPLLSSIISLIRNLTITTVILCGGLVAGWAFIIYDVLDILKPYTYRYLKKWTEIQSNILSHLQHNLIIDDILKDAFATDGWISCMYGTFIGTIVVYALPLSKELRFRVISYFCCDCWGDEEEKTKHWIHQILFQPGGVWKALVTDGEDGKDRAISTCTSNQLQVSDQHDDKETKEGEEGANATTVTLSMMNPLDTDLELTIEADDFDENDELSSSVDNTATTTTTTVNSPTTLSPMPQSLSVSPMVSQNGNAKSKTQPNVNRHRQETQVDTPEKIMKDIMQHICLKIHGEFNSKFIMNNLNQTMGNVTSQMQTIGTVSAFALCLQMRYSHVARRAVYNMAQGSVAVGLASLAVTSFSSALCSKRIFGTLSNQIMGRMEQDMCNNNYAQDEEGGGNSDANSPRTVGSVTAGVGTCMGKGTGVARTGLGRVRQLIELLMYRFRNDANFRRKWQGVFTIVVLYWYRTCTGRKGGISKRRGTTTMSRARVVRR